MKNTKDKQLVLLLGETENVREYARLELGELAVRCYPKSTDHYTEYKKYIRFLERQKYIKAVTTQSLEMIDIFLNSDLDFKVIRIRKVDGKVIGREWSKQEAFDLRKLFCFDLR